MSGHLRPLGSLLHDPDDVPAGPPGIEQSSEDPAARHVAPSVTSWDVARTRALTVLGAVAVGFLLSSGLWASRDVGLQQDARKADLLALLETRQARNEAMSAQLEDLRLKVTQAQEVSAKDVPALTRRMAVLESHAGLTAVAGPGVRVTLGDGKAGCSQRPDDCRIQDADLQLTANTLFALGAEALAINGERLIATSAIRSAGGSVLVNYTVLTSPYVIEAIGNPVRLREELARSGLAHDFGVWRDTYGLAFRIEAVEGVTHDDVLTLPPHTGSVQLRAAKAAP